MAAADRSANVRVLIVQSNAPMGTISLSPEATGSAGVTPKGSAVPADLSKRLIRLCLQRIDMAWHRWQAVVCTLKPPSPQRALGLPPWKGGEPSGAPLSPPRGEAL